jgi:nicotinamidase-related amidase
MSDAVGARRALIVVDVQNDYDQGGALEIAYPPFSQTLENIGLAMDAAREQGVKVVVIRMVTPEGAPVFKPGTAAADLHPEIERRHRDHYVEKQLPSAFTGTDLEYWLRIQGVETVTVVGYMSHNCDMSTVVHAFHMGFAVEFLDDASGSLPYRNRAGAVTAEELHRVMSVVFQSRFAAVMSTKEWIGHLRAGTTPERGNIFASFQAAKA